HGVEASAGLATAVESDRAAVRQPPPIGGSRGPTPHLTSSRQHPARFAIQEGIGMNLIGTSAVVTGGGQGMGRQFTKSLLEHGVNVVILELNPDTVEATARELTDEAGGSARALPHAGSVASADDVAAAFD